MMNDNVLENLRKEIERLIDEQSKTFKEALTIQNFLNTDAAQKDDTVESVKKWIEQLESEQYKLKNQEMVLAVIGTMKAGKSTTINAIVGMEILPNRPTAMTTLPTLIRNKHGQQQPVLKISKIQPLLGLSQEIAQKLKTLQESDINNIKLSSLEEGKDLINRLTQNSGYQFETEYTGQQGIFEFLKHLNDIMRLAKDAVINIEPPYNEYMQLNDLPVIEVEFCHLKGNQNVAQGSLAILDTPGPNEFGQSEALKQVLKTQLEKASAILLVVDFTQMGTDADNEVRDTANKSNSTTKKNDLGFVKDYLPKDRFSVVVNKFDGDTRMSVDETKRLVANTLMDGKVETTQVFPISAQTAYLATRAKRHLEHNNKLPNYESESWVEVFGKLALGTLWKKDIDNIEKVNACIDALLEDSLFDAPIKMVIEEAHKNAGLICLKSAISRLVESNEEFANTLSIRSATITKSIKEVQQMMDNLQADIDGCKEVRDEVRDTTKKSLSELDGKIKTAMAEQENEVVDAITKFLEDGRKMEEETKAILFDQAFENRMLTLEYWTTFHVKSKDYEKNFREKSNARFDKNGRIVRFKDRLEAEDFSKQIGSCLASIFNESNDILNKITENLISDTAQQISQVVDGRVKDTLDKAQKELQDQGVTATFSLSEKIDLAINHVNVSELFIFNEKTETHIEQKAGGFWGFLNHLNKDWGLVPVSKKKTLFEVDLEEAENKVIELLNQRKQSLSSQTESYLGKKFQPQIDSYLCTLITYLERYYGVLNDGKKLSELEQAAKLELKNQLEKLSKDQSIKKGDIVAVNCGIEQLNGADKAAD